MIKRVLVPLDGSTLAERPLDVSLALTRPIHGSLILIRAPQPGASSLPAFSFTGEDVYLNERSLEQARQRAGDYLLETCRGLAGEPIRLTAEWLEGEPASVIVEKALVEAADLIAMSTHGRSGVSRWVMGSVTERVLQRAPCPVLVCQSDKPIERVLVPLDGSELAEEALEPAFELAGRLRSTVTLLACVPDQQPDLDWVAELDSRERGMGLRMRREPESRAAAYMQRIAARFDGCAPISSVVVSGHAAEQITRHAESEQIDLIAMATHGRTGLARWIFGSVTEKVLRAGQASMLIVPSHQRRARVAAEPAELRAAPA